MDILFGKPTNPLFVHFLGNRGGIKYNDTFEQGKKADIEGYDENEHEDETLTPATAPNTDSTQPQKSETSTPTTAGSTSSQSSTGSTQLQRSDQSSMSTQPMEGSYSDPRDEDEIKAGLENKDKEFLEGLEQSWKDGGRTDLFKTPMAKEHRRYTVYQKNQDNYSVVKGNKNVTKMTGSEVKKLHPEFQRVPLNEMRNQGDYVDGGDKRLVLLSNKKDNPAIPLVIPRSKPKSPALQQLDEILEKETEPVEEGIKEIVSPYGKSLIL